MRWDMEIVEFFSIVYMLFGASAVNVLRGPMHFSEVVMENVERGKFDPRSAKINLPIPSIRTLRSLSTGYPKEIPVGLVELMLSIAEECSKKGAQYILSFDGKMVACRLKGECFGDIDLWGVEKPISMKCSLQLLERNIRACENLNSDVNENKLFAQAYRLESLMNEMSRRVRTLRQRIEGEHYLRLKLVRMSQNQTLDSRQQYSYKMQLSFLNEHSARCDSHIGRALHLNMHILSTLAMSRENSDVFTNSKVVSLHLQNNAHFLFDAERNSQFFDVDLPENFDLIKQRSPQWHALRQKAKVTGSTMYKALGLESLVALKQHHYEFLKKESRQISHQK